jgi:hypothetical protein
MSKTTEGKAPAPRKFGGRATTAAAAAAAAAGAGKPVARRGDGEPVQEVQELAEAAEAVVIAPAEPVVHVPAQSAVVKASEEENPFLFIEPPEDATPLEQMGMVRRGIARANRGLENGLGSMQKGYVGSAGEYLWWATQGTRLKDAGFKSVEKFAAPLDLTKQDVYRLRRAVPVYRIIGDLVEEPLNERTIRELFSTIVDEKGEIPVTPDGQPDVSPDRQKNLRDQFAEMKKMGRVNSGGALAARRLLLLGESTDVIEPEIGAMPHINAREQLAKARRNGRILDLEVLREAKKEDPEGAQQYVDDLRRKYEAAAEIVG